MLQAHVRPFAWVLFTVASVAAAAQPERAAPVRQVEANGTRLSYVDQGSGAPVVFVHGAAADLRYWEPQRAAVAGERRFVAYSYRYHGAGKWPDDGAKYSADQHASDLAAFIAALKAGPVHLVGLSYGGLLAVMVARKEPQLVRSLTLAEPALFSLLAERAEDKPVLEEWREAVEPIAAAIKAGDSVAATRQLIAVVTGAAPEEFDKLPAPLRQILLDNARTLPAAFAVPMPAITCEMLRDLEVPTLVVRGAETPHFFVRINDAVERCIPGSKQAVIPKASHAMSYDNPAAFNRVLLEFVRGVPGSAAELATRAVPNAN